MSNIAQRVTSNVIWLLTSDIVFRGAVFVGTLYIARVLETAEFGIYSFAIAVSNFIWVAADLGISQYGTREVAKTPDSAEDILSTLNSLRFTVSILAFVALFLALTAIDSPTHKRNVILAAGFYAVTYSLSPDWLLRGAETMKYLAVGNLIMGASFLLGIFLLVKSPEHTTLAASVWSLSFLMGSIGTIYLLWKKLDIKFHLVFSIPKWKEHIGESVYFAVVGSLLRVYGYVPVFLLGFLVTSEQLGIFSAPHRLVITLLTFNFVVPRAFYPVLASLHKEPEEFKVASDNFQRIMLFIGLPIGVGGMVLSEELISLLFGSLYLEGAGVLQILIWQVPLGFMMIGYGNPLTALGFQKYYAISIGAGVSLMIVISLILIPFYGIYGAAVGALVGAASILFILTYIFSKKVYRHFLFDSYFLKVSVACAIMGTVIEIAGANLIISLVLGVIVYGVLAILLGVMDIKALLGLLRAGRKGETYFH